MSNTASPAPAAAPTPPDAATAAPAAPPAAPAATPVTAPPRTVVFADQSKRLTTIDLAYPVNYDGKNLATIVIRRLTASEVASFVESLKSREDNASTAIIRFPMFYDIEGAPIADDVLDALDDDDALKLNEVASDFLPRRFAAARAE